MSGRQWHYTVRGISYGPVDDTEIKAQANSGRLTPNDLVWTEGMADWVGASTLRGLFVASTPPPPPPKPVSFLPPFNPPPASASDSLEWASPSDPRNGIAAQTNVGVNGLALWNPNAALYWSILFTPVFGAYLQALNWRTMKDSAREDASMQWVKISAIGTLAISALAVFLADRRGVAPMWISALPYGLWGAWYSVGCAQARYLVQNGLERSYTKRPWGVPFAVAIAGLVILGLLASAAR